MEGGEVEVVGGGLGRLPGRVELAFCSASALTCRAAAVLQPPSAAPLLLFFIARHNAGQVSGDSFRVLRISSAYY